MLTALVIVKVMVAVAGLALLGQGVLFFLAGAGRETNFFYRTLRIIASPATRVVRWLTPRRFVGDAHIPAATFFLMAGIYIALVITQTNLCLQQGMQHFSCAPLTTAYQERCAAGDVAACEALKRAIEAAGAPAR